MEQELGAIRSRSDEEQDQEDAHHGQSDEEEGQGRTTSKKVVKKTGIGSDRTTIYLLSNVKKTSTMHERF